MTCKTPPPQSARGASLALTESYIRIVLKNNSPLRPHKHYSKTTSHFDTLMTTQHSVAIMTFLLRLMMFKANFFH